MNIEDMLDDETRAQIEAQTVLVTGLQAQREWVTEVLRSPMATPLDISPQAIRNLDELAAELAMLQVDILRQLLTGAEEDTPGVVLSSLTSAHISTFLAGYAWGKQNRELTA